MTLRSFLRWSEEQANAVGLTPAQHQLLVAIKGHPGPEPPAIREIADYLLLQSHSAVGLVDRAEAGGFVRRRPDEKDARVVRVELTEKGDRLVTDQTEAHLTELHKLAAALADLLPDGVHPADFLPVDFLPAGLFPDEEPSLDSLGQGRRSTALRT